MRNKKQSFHPKRLLTSLRDALPKITKERREEVQAGLRSSSQPQFDFFLLVVLSSVIATQGLLVDSAAVIIGAMLVAPLMSPIIATGLASIVGDERLLRDAVKAVAQGAFVAILLSFLMTSLNSQLPFITLNAQSLPSEVLARTQPSPIDLIVALAGGLAAAFALAMPNISAALPGVAIATALMPPLCTVGIGLALGRWDVAGGAFLLFVTNTITIAFSATLVFSTLGFRPRNLFEGEGRVQRSIVIAGMLTAVLLIPLTWLSIQFVRDANENRSIDEIITEEVGNLPDVDLVDWDIVRGDGTMQIVLDVTTTTPLRYEDGASLQDSIGGRLQVLLSEPTAVEIVLNQVLAVKLDPRIPPTFTLTPTSTDTPTLTLTPTPTLTFTPGPSPTATHTPTPTFTLTPSPTNTPNPTTTPTLTPTATPTNTPESAGVVQSTLPGLSLRQSPAGPIIARLRVGDVMTVLYRSETVNGLVWVEVIDREGRVGWIPAFYLNVFTPEPSPTHTPTDETATSTPTMGASPTRIATATRQP